MDNNVHTDAPQELTYFVTTLLCLSLSIMLLTVTVAALHATVPRTFTFVDSLVMLAIAAIVFFSSLAVLFVRRTGSEDDDDDDSPLRVASRLVCTSLWFLPVPTAVYIGGRVSVEHPSTGWIIGALTILLLPLLILIAAAERQPEVLRGTVILTTVQAKHYMAHITRPIDLIINWLGLQLPEHFAEQHFLLVGATGSGKTVALRLLIQSVLSSIIPGSDRRMLIYDAKQDILEILSGIPLFCPVVILNPFDARSVAWDIAKDITNPGIALQIAAILIQEERGDNSFFCKAARDLLAAVFIALHAKQPGNWTLADVVAIMSSTDRTKHLLEDVPSTRHVAEEHFRRADERTTANVQYTVTANMAYLRPIAALWHHAARRFSLSQWVNSESILVLGNMESLRCPLDAVNRALFQRIVELLLGQSESDTRRTWVVLDELKEMGRLDALPRLLTKGRTKGIRAVLAFQTIEGLRDVYGDRLAGEVSGMPANKCFLRTDSEETARWASHVIGEAEYREWTQTENSDGKTSRNEHIVKKEAMLASQLMRLPLANRKRFYSYCITPSVGVHAGVTRFDQSLCPKGSAANFLPRPDAEQYLPPDLLADQDDPALSLDDITRMRARRNSPTVNPDPQIEP